jgi:hypothetical protein
MPVTKTVYDDVARKHNVGVRYVQRCWKENRLAAIQSYADEITKRLSARHRRWEKKREMERRNLIRNLLEKL